MVGVGRKGVSAIDIEGYALRGKEEGLAVWDLEAVRRDISHRYRGEVVVDRNGWLLERHADGTFSVYEGRLKGLYRTPETGMAPCPCEGTPKVSGRVQVGAVPDPLVAALPAFHIVEKNNVDVDVMEKLLQDADSNPFWNSVGGHVKSLGRYGWWLHAWSYAGGCVKICGLIYLDRY